MRPVVKPGIKDVFAGKEPSGLSKLRLREHGRGKPGPLIKWNRSFTLPYPSLLLPSPPPPTLKFLWSQNLVRSFHLLRGQCITIFGTSSIMKPHKLNRFFFLSSLFFFRVIFLRGAVVIVFRRLLSESNDSLKQTLPTDHWTRFRSCIVANTCCSAVFISHRW